MLGLNARVEGPARRSSGLQTAELLAVSINVSVRRLRLLTFNVRASMNIAASTIFLAIAFVSACVPYPIYKTLQPSAQVTVLSQASQPLPTAEATLVSNAYPYGWEKHRETKETLADGTATFDSMREWRAEVLMIHGAEVFFWNWCVRKEGYVTYLTANRSAEDFRDNLVVRLEPGKSAPCPKSFR